MSKTNRTTPLEYFVLAEAGIKTKGITLDEMKEYVRNSEIPTELFRRHGLAQDSLRRIRNIREKVHNEQNGTRRSEERKFSTQAKNTLPEYREELDFSYQDVPLSAEIFHRY